MFRSPLISGLSFLFLLFFSSCSSFEDGGDSRFYQSKWCVVQQTGSDLYLLADDSDLLVPSTALDASVYKPSSRYKVYYYALSAAAATKASGKLIQLGVLQPVVIQHMEEGAEYAGLLGDPVSLNENPFVGGDFLNVNFGFKEENYDIKHKIVLVRDSLVGGTCYLRFLHMANGDGQSSKKTALMSFLLSDFQDRLLIDSLAIRFTLRAGSSTEYRIDMKK
jgi:hypothetical protein